MPLLMPDDSNSKPKVTCYSHGEGEWMRQSQELRGKWLAPFLQILDRLKINANHLTFFSLLTGLAFCPFFLLGYKALSFGLLLAHEGLVPVENLGIPSVWIDHIAYRRQREKLCAFNLYAAAAMRHALAPICRAFGEDKTAESAEAFGDSLLKHAQEKFWSRDLGLFVNNLPCWLRSSTGNIFRDRIF